MPPPKLGDFPCHDVGQLFILGACIGRVSLRMGLTQETYHLHMRVICFNYPSSTFNAQLIPSSSQHPGL